MSGLTNDEVDLLTGNLTKNQHFKIRKILNGDFDANCPIFIDIIPCYMITEELVISKQTIHDIDQHYGILFHFMGQAACKIISKEWIKYICPNKQKTFPYKFDVKPDWWPSDVPHVEPDHMDKSCRIRLMIHLLRNESVDLVKFKSVIRDINGLSKDLQSSKPLINKLIYEVFYINLYERFFFNYGVNNDLLNFLTPQEQDMLKGSSIVLTVSWLPTQAPLEARAQFNTSVFPLKKESKKLEKGQENGENESHKAVEQEN